MAFQLFPQASTFGFSLISSIFLPWWKGDISLLIPRRDDRRLWRRNRSIAVIAASDSALYKMNLNEYMVTIERPLGIRFALSLDGNIFVHSMKRGGHTSRKAYNALAKIDNGNAERSKIIMVGDTLKKASDALGGGGFNDIKDLSDAEKIFKNFGELQSLVLERPFSPFPIHKLHLNPEYHILFNKGKVPFATWNVSVLASNLPSAKQLNSGFAIFSPKFLNRQGRELLLSQDINDCFDYNGTNNAKDVCEIVGICSEENSENTQWVHGTFPLDEYVKALERAKGELYYDHSLGMQFNKITEQIYVGSCIQLERDVQKLSNLGITAVLNFQSGSERANWGINSRVINESCSRSNILMVNYPIREVDTVDLRKKLPFSVGLLLRLLRKNHRIFVTCTTGFDRSPACVIAYLHWIQDASLGAAHNFVAGLHSCRPDRPAIVWATWDLIAMVENEKNDRSPTHVVNFVWSSGCREGEEVFLIGDFTGNWKESIKAVHKGGSRYEAEVRLRHGKYCYKFIVGGQWRHSTALPTKRDEHGNVNNVIQVGDVARIRSRPIELQIKDPTVVKVIERRLTEDERFMLAFAARRIAFAICPIKLTPK